MRCYKVTGGGLVQYAATQADAKVAKADIAEAAGLSLKEVLVEQTDVPMDKPSLLAFINSLVSQRVAGAREEAEDAEEESSEDTRASRRRRRRGH